jgi:4-hydroxybenzoate polyprenyltransferase
VSQPASLPGRWWRFARERFDPPSSLAMIVLYFSSHWVVHRLAYGADVALWRRALLLLGTAAFFFKLRLYDEIKDYEVDLKLNPTRPLARGLLKHRHLHAGIAACIGLELAAFGLNGWPALASIAFAILYSLLMYREFFAGALLRPHLTTYAVLHTVVSGFLSLALFAAFQHRPFWALEAEAYFFALNSWCLFNIFEFGRKTFTSSEERPQVESYSRIFGRYGAVALVLAMSLASSGLLAAAGFGGAQRARLLAWLTGIFLLMAALGVAYAFLDRAPYGKIYRGMSSGYVVLVYGSVLVAYLW